MDITIATGLDYKMSCLKYFLNIPFLLMSCNLKAYVVNLILIHDLCYTDPDVLMKFCKKYKVIDCKKKI